MGQIITFYSYKGGVGRTMALANVAVLLSQWGYKVLMIDWDLEAPGLENFFKDFIHPDKVTLQKGVIDILDAYSDGKRECVPGWRNLILSIGVQHSRENLYLLTAGRRDNGYFHKVRSLDVGQFYTEKNGGAFIEKLRNEWKKEYDFILVDSRTGITDIGGICTVHLPDVLVALFTATKQGFYGALNVVQKANIARQKLPVERLSLVTIPIPSRFDTMTEFKISQKWLDIFSRDLDDVYANWLPTSVKKREMLEHTKIPYVSYFSFGEKLPVIEHGTSDPSGLGYAYESLAALISHNLESVELLFEDREDYIRL
jgi:cellulose biosynthesis protein BcsQ